MNLETAIILAVYQLESIEDDDFLPTFDNIYFLLTDKFSLAQQLSIDKYRPKLGNIVGVFETLFSDDLDEAISELVEKSILEENYDGQFLDNAPVYSLDSTISDLTELIQFDDDFSIDPIDKITHSVSGHGCEIELYKEDVVFYYDDIEKYEDKAKYKLVYAVINLDNEYNQKIVTIKDYIYYKESDNTFAITKTMEDTILENEKYSFLGNKIIEKDSKQIKTVFKELTPGQTQSILYKKGYTVSESKGLTAYQRHTILLNIINENILTKVQVVSFLLYLIDRNQNNQKFIRAISCWEADIDYLYSL
jgi:hypothetical protein